MRDLLGRVAGRARQVRYGLVWLDDELFGASVGKHW
jgi:hypothetical protein